MREEQEDEDEEEWDEEQEEEELYEEDELTTESRLLQLRIHHARNVPRVDTFSESDPYVVVRAAGMGRKPPRTITIQDDANPVWEEDFYLECEAYVADGRLQGVIELEVWDEDVMTDSVIGKTTLDLGKFHSMDWAMIELPLVLVDKVKAKYEKQLLQQQKRGFFGRKQQAGPDQSADQTPMLVVSIVGSIPSFANLAQNAAELPDSVVDERAQMVLLPVSGFQVMVGVQYGTSPRKGPRYVLLSTQEWDVSGSRLRMDFDVPPDATLPDAPTGASIHGSSGSGEAPGAGAGKGRRSSQDSPSKNSSSQRAASAAPGAEPQLLATIERLQWPKGRKLTPSVRVFEEASLVNLPLSVDPATIQVLLARKLPVVAYDAATLLTGAGWQGPGVSFKLALSSMSEYAAGYSKSAQEVYIAPDDELPPACVMALDFLDVQQTQLGPTPCVVAYPNRASGLHWELSGEGEVATRAQDQLYTRSLRIMKGEARFRTRRRLRLVDPNGELLCQETMGGLQLVGYELDHARQVEWPLLGMLYGETGEEEEQAARGKSEKQMLHKLTETIGDIKGSIQDGFKVASEGLKGLGNTGVKGLGSLLGFGKRDKGKADAGGSYRANSGSSREWQEAREPVEPQRRSRMQRRAPAHEVEYEEEDEEESPRRIAAVRSGQRSSRANRDSGRW